MLIAQIVSLSIICATSILGITILLHNPRKRPNQVLTAIVFNSAVWVFTNFMVDMAKTDLLALRWSQATLIGPILIPPLFLYLSYIFPRSSKLTKLKRFFIFLPFLLLALVPTHYNIQDAHIITNGIPEVTPGILYIPFFIYFLGFIMLALYKFFKNIKKSSVLEKLQIEYVIIGTVLAVSVGLVANVLLLLLGVSEASSFGPHATIFWTVFLSFAILKHHLFNIKVIATELFTALLILLLFINIFLYNTSLQLFLNITVFTGSLIFGIFLLKSVLNEVKQREKMEEMAKELAIANIKLKKLDASKSEFLSIASHQLRTPLTAIGGYLSMVLEGTYGKITEKIRRPVANVFQASRQLNQLVNTLLSVSRIEAGKMKLEAKMLSLGDLIKPIVEEFKIVAQEKGLYLKLSLPTALPFVSIDQEKMNQAMMNIIDNAIKYTKKGGIDISIDLKRGESGERALIRIKDTGAGMDKEQISQIFEKFKRGKAGKTSWSKGAGLGLFIAKKFVELHNGKIWAESKGIDKGTEFFIELPIK
ncbi:ATP-binding protein [Patescibacteria group bacterium]|nr:ATP-binding protein [Patescibacteria group bacterium]